MPTAVSLAQYGHIQSSGWPRAAARWITLPSNLYAGFKDGSFRGITVGPGPSTAPEYYGRFGNGGHAIIRATYLK